jgi:oligopeptide/dipeptide ABC transporter ATP-binding protein
MSEPQPVVSAAPQGGALLEVEDLVVDLRVEGEMRTVLRGVSLQIAAGEAVSLVGESGSGKSMTARAVSRLLPAGAAVSGRISYNGNEITELKGQPLRQLHNEVAMIFQDPRAHINPVRTIGDFMTEALVTNNGVAKDDARQRATQALADVGISDGARRLKQYPHELSGGLLQRVMIASTLLTDPKLLLADEPTTALDVTTQSEVIAILDELRRERGLALLFITHDLDLADAVCDRACVMYAGQIVESRSTSSSTRDALHPYTRALGSARPVMEGPVTRPRAIPGRPVSAFEAPSGCAFAPRCEFAQQACTESEPQPQEFDGDIVRCLRASEFYAA